MIGLLIGFACGWMAHRMYIQHQAMKLMRSIAPVATEIDKTAIFIEVEQHGSSYFFYDKSTGKFICKGDTVEELNDSFHARFPEKHAVIVAGDEALVKYLEVKFEEYFESLEGIKNT